MEAWEIDYIRQRKPVLLRDIKCTDPLLATLSARKILSQFDIETIGVSDGNSAKTNKLLDILVTRTGAYEIFLQALQETGQSGAARLLSPKPQFIEEYSEIFEGEDGNKLKAKVGEKILASTALGNVLNLDLDFMPHLVQQSSSYYIPRTIISRRGLNPKLFSYNCPDIFIFTGINSTELSELVKPNITDETCNQTNEITVRFMLLVFDEDFEEICKISACVPVHLIERKNKIFELVKSHGSIQAIQRFLDGHQIKLSEEAFIRTIVQQKSSSPVCIADTPGMGKTALFASIAKQVQQHAKKEVVIFISFKNLFNKIPDSFDFTKHQELFNILAESAADSPIKADILAHILIHKVYPVYLFLDAFDEIPANKQILSNKLLKHLTCDKTMANIKTLVTTRPHVAPDLEISLGVLAYSIKPFRTSDQIKFLAEFWEQECGAVRNAKLVEFSKCCVSRLQNKIVFNLDHDIAGIPLQCKLLAQVYANDAKKYSKGSSSQIPMNVTSIFEMYNRFFEKSFNKAENEIVMNNVVLTHQYAALDALYPNWSVVIDSTDVQNEPNFRKLSLSEIEIYEFGILEKKHYKLGPNFVHKSFAEYLVASWLSDKLITFSKSSEGEKFVKFLLASIFETDEYSEQIFEFSVEKNSFLQLFKFTQPATCYFLESFLKMEPLAMALNRPPRYLNILSNSLQQTNEDGFYLSEIFSEKISSCIYHDFHNLFIFLCVLFLCGKDSLNFLGLQSLSWPQILLLCTKYSCVQLINSCYQCYKFIHDNNLSLEEGQVIIDTIVITPLHLAARQGSFRKVEYLLRNTICDENQNLSYPRSILHFCVMASENDTPALINQKKEIIKLLVSEIPLILNERLEKREGETPLHMQNIHLELIKHLVQLGANVYSVNIMGNNVAHIAASYMNSENFHLLVDFLVKSNFQDVMTCKNYSDYFPFQIADHNFMKYSEIIELTSPQVNFKRDEDKQENLPFTDNTVIQSKQKRSGKLFRRILLLPCGCRSTKGRVYSGEKR